MRLIRTPQPVKDLIEKWLKTLPQSVHPASLTVWTCWPEIVGSTLAQQSLPHKIERGVLWVYAQDSTVAHMLHCHAPDILQRIQERKPTSDLTSVKTRIWNGPTPLQMAPSESLPVTPEPLMECLMKLTPEQQLTMLETLKDVPDAEIKERLLSLWARGLARLNQDQKR